MIYWKNDKLGNPLKFLEIQIKKMNPRLTLSVLPHFFLSGLFASFHP